MKRYRLFALVAGLAAGLIAAPSAAVAQIRIDLNIPALRLIVWEGNEQIANYPVAVGLPEFPTPTGNYTVSHAEWNPWWNPPTDRPWARGEKRTPPGPNNPMGRVKLFFMPLYFIHGTPAGESIGTPASHGCVRMLNEDVIALARLLHQRAAPEVTAARLDQLSRPSSNTQRVNFSGTIEINIRYDAVEVTGSEIFVYPDIYSMNRLHSESVYQALMRAGYSPDNIDYTEVRRLIDRAQGLKAPLVMKLDEVFSAGLVQAAR